MTNQAVCDSSAIVAMLVDGGEVGASAARLLTRARLAAPAFVTVEAANILRRHEAAKSITVDQAAQAHADLLDLPIELWPHSALAHRAWELRRNLTISDASYVALAEMLESPLITLDARMSRAPGIRCEIQVLSP